MFHSQQSDARRERELALAFSGISGHQIFGVSTRRRRTRHEPYTRLPRAQTAIPVPEIEVIDLTEGTSRETQRDEDTSQGLLHERGY